MHTQANPSLFKISCMGASRPHHSLALKRNPKATRLNGEQRAPYLLQLGKLGARLHPKLSSNPLGFKPALDKQPCAGLLTRTDA